MREFTKNLIRRNVKASTTTVGNVILYWDAQIESTSGLKASILPWADKMCRVASARYPRFRQMVVKIAWSSDFQINLKKTARAVVEDLAGAQLWAGRHDPLSVQGIIIAGCRVARGDFEYAVILAAIYPRERLSKALEMLKAVERSEHEITESENRLDSVEIIFDPRDVDKGELTSTFDPLDFGIQVSFATASHNASPEIVEQFVRIATPISILLALAWGTPYLKKVQEKLGEAHGEKLARATEAWVSSITGLARRSYYWRRPISNIESMHRNCHIMLQFKKVPPEALAAKMVLDLRRAVDELMGFIDHYHVRGEPLRSVAYEFSLDLQRWRLHMVMRRDGVILSNELAVSLVKVANQSSSLGIREDGLG